MMEFKKLYCTTILSLTAVLLQSCDSVSASETRSDVEQTSDISTLQTSPEKARVYDYCKWAFEQGGKAHTLPDYESMLDRKTSTLSPNDWTATALVDAGAQIAQSAKTQKTCAKSFAKGTGNFNRQIKKSLKKHWSQAKYKKSGDKTIAAVQEDLASHWVKDQAARRVYLASKTDDKTGPDYWTRTLAVAQTSLADASSTQYMKELLNEYDWIDIERFGDRVSMAAWLMVQHADDHVELQSLALSRMEPYLKSGGVSKDDYAFLWDRVAVNSGEKQRYGTQPTWECTPEGNLTLQPLEDPDNVNARRETMGMGTVEDGLEGMARSVCR